MDELVALEGAFLIERAVAAAMDFEAVYCVPAREAWARRLGLEPRVLAEARIAEIAGYPFHRGAYALARRPAALALPDILPTRPGPSRILILPESGDPENLGASFRNAAALGCSALLLGPTGPDPYSRRALRVSMGACLSLPWARLASPAGLRELSARGFSVAACVLDPEARSVREWEVPKRLALVLGNEAHGLSGAWLEACSDRVTLPMQGGADSLNVATAAAVLLYATAYGEVPTNATAV
jgi:tRNA G18 (ribose-2'-O)-methylase SpoU